MPKLDELDTPGDAADDPRAFEIIRVWIVNDGLHVSLRSSVWKDPFAYGIMLCDLMQHIANAYEQNEGFDRAKTLQRIKEGFVAEAISPTDRPTGH